MADTTFVSGTVIASTWLNEINDLFYTTLGGATTAAGVRSAVSAAQSGANSDITSLTGLTTPLSVAQGGTGAATLTANNVLLGNGTSAPTFVAPGTAGNVLTSNGTTWQSAASAGTFVLLSTATASSSSTIDIETTFDSTYDEYLLVCSNVLLSGSTTLSARFKISGSYLTSNYNYHTAHPDSNATTYSASASNAATGILLVPETGDAIDLDIRVHHPAATGVSKSISFSGCTRTNATASWMSITGAGRNSGTTAALTGVRLLPGTGTITSGTFRLYGIKNS